MTPDLSGAQILAHGLHAESLLIGAAVVGGAGMAVTATRRAEWSLTRVLFVVAVGGLGFQIVHVLEHVLQAGYWVAHPTEAPWLTPWAIEGREVLAQLADGRAGSGNELLHLLGNTIFLGGLVALEAWRRRTQRLGGRRALRWGLVLQGAHVADHLLLTTTWLVLDYTWGATTLFGLIPAGTVLGHAVRVWVHFAINTAATVAALVGALRCGAVDALWRPAARTADSGSAAELPVVAEPSREEATPSEAPRTVAEEPVGASSPSPDQ